MMRNTLLTGIGGVLAALFGSLCCAGPVVFVTLGIGAGLASTFEPLRPVFGITMMVLLAIGFYTVYGRARRASDVVSGDRCTDESCAVVRNRRRDRVLFWSAVALSLVFWSFPTWSRLFV